MKASTTQTQTYTSKLYRTGLSTYQASNFRESEKLAVNSIGVEYQETLKDTDILVTNTHLNLKDLDQQELKKVKLIIHPNSGYDNFDPAIVQAIKAPIILGNEIRAQAVATYILGCFYHAFSTPPFSSSWDKSRNWPRKSLKSVNVQIIGNGHIAKILSDSLGHLVSKLSFYDPYKNNTDLNIKADCFIMACSLNKSNHMMINSSYLKQLKEDCVFINAARGGLVDMNHLITWLTHNPKAKAYLDVFQPEPFDFSLMPKNSFNTSHLAGVDQLLDQRIIDFVTKVSNDWMTLSPQDFESRWKEVYLSTKILNNEFI